jgi:hypothetical protein
VRRPGYERRFIVGMGKRGKPADGRACDQPCGVIALNFDRSLGMDCIAGNASYALDAL